MAVVRIDDTELRTLAFDLGGAGDRADDEVRKVVQKAALNIKRDLQAEATGSPSFDRVAASISYETYAAGDGWVAEIGPEFGHERGHARAQGSLAWIAYEGTARGGPVFPDPSGALEREAEAFERYLGIVIGDSLL